MKNRILIALILSCSPMAVDAQVLKPAGSSQQVEIELTVVECSFPGGKSPLASHPFAWSDIEHLPAKSVILLDRVLVPGKSGERAVVNHIANPAATMADSNQKAEFAPGESGTIVELEPVVAPDATYCDVNIAYQFRKQIDVKDAKTLQDVNFTTSFTAGIDKPLIINVSAVPDHEGTFIAVVARAHLVDSGKRKADADAIRPLLIRL